MRVYLPEPPRNDPRVVRVIEVDFGLFSPPVRLGESVTYTLVQQGDQIIRQMTLLSGMPNTYLLLEEGMRYLVEFDDGEWARASKPILNRMLGQLGQPLI